jgi:hypothetical protein
MAFSSRDGLQQARAVPSTAFINIFILYIQSTRKISLTTRACLHHFLLGHPIPTPGIDLLLMAIIHRRKRSSIIGHFRNYSVGAQEDPSPLGNGMNCGSCCCKQLYILSKPLLFSSLVNQETIFRLRKKVGHSASEKDCERGSNRFVRHDSRKGMSRVEKKQLNHLTASSSPCKAGCRSNPKVRHPVSTSR